MMTGRCSALCVVCLMDHGTGYELNDNDNGRLDDGYDLIERRRDI